MDFIEEIVFNLNQLIITSHLAYHIDRIAKFSY